MSAIAEDAIVFVRLQLGAASTIDTDLQAVVVDREGKIIDSARHNNMQACGGEISVHSGGDGARCERISFNFQHIPTQVHMILVVVCCCKTGTLNQVPGATVLIEQAKPTKQLLQEDRVEVEASGLLVGTLARAASGGWLLRPVGEALLNTRHFMDCLPAINRHIVVELPTASRTQKVQCDLEKGGNFDFGGTLTKIVLGLGWDVEFGNVDLGASAVLLDQDAHVLESVYSENLICSGVHSAPGAVEHSGKRRKKKNGGDAEHLTVCLDQLGTTVRDIFLCIHIRTKTRKGLPKTFIHVATPYCRVVEGGRGGQEICRYTLLDAGSRSGLIIARIRRGFDGRFSFNALGVPSRGTTHEDCIPELQRISCGDLKTLVESPTRRLVDASPCSVVSSMPSSELDGIDPQLLDAVSAMPSSPKQKCCIVQ